MSELKLDEMGTLLKSSARDFEVPEFFSHGIDRILSELPENPATVKVNKTFVPKKWWTRTALVSAACSVFFAGSVICSPSFAAYAKSIPLLGIAADWVQQCYGYDGVQNAKEHNYSPGKSVTVNHNGASITVEDLYLENNLLTFLATVKANDIKEKGVWYKLEPVGLDLNTKEGGSSAGTIRNKGETNEQVIVQQYFLPLQKEQVEAFLKQNSDHITLAVKRTDSKTNNEEVLTQIQVPFQVSEYRMPKEYAVNKSLDLTNKHAAISRITVQKLTVTPTRMEVELDKQLDDGYDLDLTKGQSQYIQDASGHKYPMSENWQPLGNKLIFSPSAYFEGDPSALFLHLGTVWLTEDKAKQRFNLSMQSNKFPQIVNFHEKRITILNAEYEEGYLHLHLKGDLGGQLNPTVMPGVMVEIEGYQNKIDSNPKLQQIYDAAAYKGDVGIPVTRPNKDGVLGKGEYELYIKAPKQDDYTLSIRQFEEPIKLNLDIPLK